MATKNGKKTTMAPGAGTPPGHDARDGGSCTCDPVAAGPTTLSPVELQRIDAYWRACNYLAAGMIYLQDNPLLREPLRPSTSRTGCSATGARAPG